MLLFATVHSPFYWLIYPFIQIWKAIVVWSSIKLKALFILTVFLKSILLFLWSVISLSLILSGGLILIKTVLLITDNIIHRLSPKVYTSIQLLVLVIGSLLIFATS